MSVFAILAVVIAASVFVIFSGLSRCFNFVLLVILTIVCLPAQAQSQWSGWPGDEENDGKFVAITGPLSAIEYLPPKIIIGLPSNATKYDIEVFDGDASTMVSSRYDINTSSAGYTYTLYQDPAKDEL